jgi:hypothetical protein
MTVVEGPGEAAEIHAAVGLGVLGDRVGQEGQGGLGGVAPFRAVLEFGSRLERQGGQEGFQQTLDGVGGASRPFGR